MYLIKLKQFRAFIYTILKIISSMCKNRSRKELGFVEFCNPKTNISIIVYYTLSVTNVAFSRNRIFSLPKC